MLKNVVSSYMSTKGHFEFNLTIQLGLQKKLTKFDFLLKMFYNGYTGVGVRL